MRDNSESHGDDIAVIGMSCRFPGGATSIQTFMEMLKKGESAWSEVPKDRFDIDAYYHPSHEHRGTTVARGGHFLKEHPAYWDAPFFSVTVEEASAMDPQQRVLLEVAFECLESAGLPMSAVAGSQMACYIGAFLNDYKEVSTRDQNQKKLHSATGNGLTLLSNRISWFYDLKGPSMTVDTACSSSLVALHTACEAIRSGRNNTRTALVGGCGLLLDPDMFTSLSAMHFVSPDSRSYSFDERANGYARGEGAGMVILKHIDDALRDGDTIRAIIRGTGVNQDGKTSGITLPSYEAQADLIRSTYSNFGLDLHKTTYFESHGTGTQAGDPLEARAVGATFGADPERIDPIYIGSVKSNIGHLEGAAGIAGLIKGILSLESGLIFPQYNFKTPNPKIDLVKWKLEIPRDLIPWPRSDLRRIPINSFGYGGTNGHAILDDAFSYLRGRGLEGMHNTKLSPDSSPGSSDYQDSGVSTAGDSDLDHSPTYFSGLRLQRPRIFTITAPEQAAISRIGSQLISLLQAETQKSHLQADQCLEDLAYTLAARRSTFYWRSFIVASDEQELQKSLQVVVKTAVRADKSTNLLWVFTGQGAQWARMGSELLQYEVFATVVASANRSLASFGADWTVEEELLAPEAISRINEPQFSQSLCTIVQIGIVTLLRSWGLSPTAVVGHSSGEIAAAYTIGALSAHDAFKVAYHRGMLSQKVGTLLSGKTGAMLSVGLSRETATAYLQRLPIGSVAVIACENSPSNVTISGDKEVLEILEKDIQAAGMFARMLKVQNAYHSPYMDVVASQYLDSLRDIAPTDGQGDLKMYSTVNGSSVTRTELGAEYWVKNMTCPVEFVAALGEIFVTPTKNRRRKRKNQQIGAILEIGPHGALQGPLKQFLAEYSLSDRVRLYSVLSRGQDAITTILNTVGKLWSAGSVIDLLAVNEYSRNPMPRRSLTDLPSYPWNHVVKYWHESSQSRNHRYPVCGRLDYAGMPVEDFNSAEPLFKNALRPLQIPWLLDHKVQNEIVFPAAGMICAAIEVSKQFIDRNLAVAGFELRDICLGQALLIPSDDSGVETFLQLRPRKTGMRSRTASWSEWTFYSISEQGITSEHASGLISIVYDSAHSEIDGGREATFHLRDQQSIYEGSRRQCTRSVTKTKHYEDLQRLGLEYGSTFQGLGDIVTTESTCCTTVTIPDTPAVMPAQTEMQSVIHPAVLDTLFQSCHPALTGDGAEIVRTMVPSLIEGLFVPADMKKLPGESFKAVTRVVEHGARDLKVNIIAANAEWSRPSLMVTGLTVTAIGSQLGQAIDSEAETATRSKICSESVLRPDLSFVNNANAQILLGKHVESTELLRKFRHDSAKAVSIWAKRALSALKSNDEVNVAPHLQNYHEWLQSTYSIAETKNHFYQKGIEDWLCMSKEDEDKFLAEFGAACKDDGVLMNRIGESLPQILTGDLQPLSVILGKDVLRQSYSHSHVMASGIKIVQDWFDLAGHKNPSMKIIEIGAGTGATALPSMKILSGQNGSPRRFEKYTFTDISSDFFENAQNMLGEWGDLVEFKKLDVSRDPEEQGFTLGSFDVVTAVNVLHATADIHTTLKNCLKLLKPGGRLLLGELTVQADFTSMTCGILPECWLSKDGRVGGPPMSEQQWDVKLLEAGFSGVDFTVCDNLDKHIGTMSVMTSTKPLETSEQLRQLIIVVQEESHLHEQLTMVLSDLAAAKGVKVKALPLRSAAMDAKDANVICLREIGSNLLPDISTSTFEDVKAIISKSSRLLWVTSSATAHNPEHSMVSGLFRSASNENDLLRLHELHLSGSIETKIQSAAELIFKAFTENFGCDNDLAESEMVEIDNVVHIPRYIDFVPMNNHLQRETAQPKPELQPLIQEDRPLKLTVGSPGILDSLHFINDESHEAPLPSDYVEIQVFANALNSHDMMTATGKGTSQEFGSDGAGIVTRIGSAVTALSTGDRVAFIKFGCFSTFVRCHESIPQRLLPTMTLEDVCTIPTVFTTAYQCLVEVGRLQPEETLLVHAASGGLGQALIQLAQNIEADVFVTVGTIAKKELMISLGIKEDHIFSSRDLSYAEGIMRVTSGRGVDVVISSLAGENLRKTWGCVAEFGRYLEVGKIDIEGNTGLEMLPFRQNRTFASINIEHVARRSVPRCANLMAKVFDILRQGLIKPVSPLTVYDWSDMGDAFRTLQQGEHTGKLVLKVTSASNVPVMPKEPAPFALQADATYILSGGLGGLGRSQALYMAQHGARNLVFLSRSGAARPEAVKTIHDLCALGVRAEALACDITNIVRLREVVASLSTRFPPIKGVIQGAMVINDGLLENMTHQQWLAATRPKIQGTWNLHDALPKDLDFFIMLSSCAGILGNRGQANYSAGNTFQDAFAAYRRGMDLQALSLDLGIITGAGFFEENTKHDSTSYLNKLSAIHINEHCLLSILGQAMSGFKLPAQLVLGIGTGGLEKLNRADGKGSEFFWLSKFARFSYLKQLDAGGTSSATDSEGVNGVEAARTQLMSASSIQQASDICQEALVAKLAKSILIDPADIDTNKPLHHFGVDSLVAVEIRTFIMREVKSDISVFEILANSPITQLAASIATKSKLLPKELIEDDD